jgi:hypothetical protein
VRDHFGVLLVAILLVVTSSVLTDIVPNKHVSTLSKGILIAGSVLLAFVAAYGDLSRLAIQRRLDGARTAWDVERTEQLTRVSLRATLLQRESEELGEALSEVRNAFESFPSATALDVRKACVKASLKALCRVFESDKHLVVTDPLKAVYVKATIFEYESGGQGAGLLVRRYWHYPDTIQPRTDHWDLRADSNAGCVQAYLRRQEVVMESVASAAEGGEVWKDSRPGQHREYSESSMVCIPIWAESQRGAPGESAVRAVMTVDTNQVGFFRSSEDERAFRAQIVGPFLGIIRLAYVITTEQDALKRGREV